MPSARFTIALVALTVPALAAHADEATRALDEALLKEAKVSTNGPALLQFFRDRTLSSNERARLQQVVRELGDEEFNVRQKASRTLIQAGHNAVPFLRPALKDPDLEISRRAARCLDAIENGSEVALAEAAARLLAERRPEGATEVVLDYLPFVCDEVVEDELQKTLVSVGLRDGKADPALINALKSKSPQLRAAAALVVARSSAPAERDDAKLLLKDADAMVRFEAARGLVAGKQKEAVPVLMAFLKEGPKDLAWQSEDLLFRIAGDDAPQISLGAGSDSDREKCQHAWHGWWDKNGAALDLAEFELEDRYLNRVLIVAYNGYGSGTQGGKIWERRPDGKESWAITGLMGPCDAHLLPGNRVIIAERYGRRVTERDTKGKIVWQFDIPNRQYPVSCQRLPNGNTFIATYNQLMEVTPDKKTVYSHTQRNGTTYAATKLRNGRILYVTSSGNLYEMDSKGKQHMSLGLGGNSGWTSIQSLPGGRFLIPRSTRQDVVEIDRAGREVMSYKSPGTISAHKLPNGNLLVCRSNDRTVAEISRTGKVVWSEQIKGQPFCARGR